MDALLLSMVTVGVAELGDKTQLLVLVLANRFRRPLSVALGMVLAFVGSHFLAAFGGAWLDRLIPDDLLSWLVGLGFLALGVWAFVAREPEGLMPARPLNAGGVLLTTWLAFSVVEFADKSQLATLGLSAALAPMWAVATGAVLGATLVNLPVIWIGHHLTPGQPLEWARRLAALVFLVIGLWILIAQILSLSV